MTKTLAPCIHDFGGEGKTIILLHGFLASSAYWRRLQPKLSRAGYRVITIDLLGFGNAPKPSHIAYNYREHLQHINHAIESLELQEPFILAGHSMGALLAMRFARVWTERVASLILLHPPLYATAEQAYKVLRSSGVHYRFLLDSKFRSIGWGIARHLSFGHTKMLHTKRSREGSLKHVIETGESMSDLKQVQVKTLLVVGLRDRKEYVDNIKSVALNDQLSVKLEPVDHHSPLRRPRFISHMICDFSYVSK